MSCGKECKKEEKKEFCCMKQEMVCPIKRAYGKFLNKFEKASIGHQAPLFKAKCFCPKGTLTEFNLEDFKGKFVVLLFYPLDWTFVCPTEMLGYSKLAEEMKDVQFVGISVDSVFTHKAWCDAPKEIGGIGKLAFPLVSDIKKCISIKYNMLNIDEGIARRGYVIIDDKGLVRYTQTNDDGIGRNTEETKRIIEAIKFSDKHGDVCPLNWVPGKDTMKPTPDSMVEYLKKHHQK
ncbi:hypothetical protein EIN_381430 [Entamoeba invadens IP1]|uniref:Thioredoxin domain-containing protein n=1 Tax=Entamoeba invadens IP1 TaxID=370355 RepID=A0A0A1UEF7_ENTIV|nr:hypothetical protein EIN_381430 [Entamoeba invadens IP1]ELP92176.1 hypothetical protein EIN_381430 [Entamoeba invadens IP1]|eukprot:XP_004258947.1 hypothetical protein EIN_381430 [Entamoeba invadens IP1]